MKGVSSIEQSDIAEPCCDANPLLDLTCSIERVRNSRSLDARETREPVECQSRAAVERMPVWLRWKRCEMRTRMRLLRGAREDLQSTECRSCDRLERLDVREDEVEALQSEVIDGRAAVSE